MDRLKMHSDDGVVSNIEIIAKFFPSCITETKDSSGNIKRAVDFDKLKAELADNVAANTTERYQFTWPDKLKASHLANTPTTSTLRPCRAESEDFDHTQNLYIEGDNLEVLKVLRHTYAGKVKMIYIDPPYNTGNDFVYEDDFAIDANEYQLRSGQKDESGQRLVANKESNGRFHTDWLNMIYPRLKLARELLSDDGVIFISIDDNEVDNLKKVCSELFGANNFIAQFCIKRSGGRQDSKHFALHHEYIICFAKNKDSYNSGSDINTNAKFSLLDPATGRFYKTQLLRKWGDNSLRFDRPNLYYPITGPDGQQIYPIIYKEDKSQPQGFIEIDGCWRWGKSLMENNIKLGLVEFKKDRFGHTIPYEKVYASDKATKKLYSTWIDMAVSGKDDFKQLFKLDLFSYPKSIALLTQIIKMANLQQDDICLDFFSGSATTAHAVMHMNATDNGKRKFIMVQLPEEVPVDSEAFKAGYKNICEIAKERIRRAGAAIKKEMGELTCTVDTGFRVLKLDSSNMEDTFYKSQEYTQASLFEDNIKSDRTSEDLLFQAMLETGALLSETIEVSEFNNKQIFNVANGYLIACFDQDLDLDTITYISKLNPVYFLCRDASLLSDSVADNIDQVFKAYSPDTICKVL